MRDRQAVYADITAPEQRAHWQSVAIATVMTLTSVLLYWPTEHRVLAGCLVVLAAAIGCAWAELLPPRRRKRRDSRAWLAAAAGALLLLGLALVVGPFVFTLGLVGALAYLATFTINVARFRRRHAVAPA